MKLVNWVLLTFLLIVAADIVAIGTYLSVKYLQVPTCRSSTDMKREVHEVYPLLDK